METNSMRKGKTTGKTFSAFTLAMIATNKEKSGYSGMHTVYPLSWADGASFNAIAAEEFGTDRDTIVTASKKLIADGKVAMVPAKGGVRLYAPTDAPTSGAAKGVSADVLANVADLIG